MTENYKNFLAKIAEDKELTAKAESAADAKAIIALAAELGITLTEDDIADSADLSDDDLDAVTGGVGVDSLFQWASATNNDNSAVKQVNKVMDN